MNDSTDISPDESRSKKIKDILSRLPDEPGVYMMLGRGRNIIYIGKANSLKKRVSSYFTKTLHDPKTLILVKNITDIEYIITDTEIEALILESNLIKKHRPKYNVRLKDDKMYPYISVTLSEEYPRVIYTRKVNRRGDRFFGPYTDARAARNTAVMINSLFKLKTCRRPVPFKPGERPCLNFQMKKCSGVCLGIITRDEYMILINSAVEFLDGKIEPVIRNLEERMNRYSSAMEFEKAATYRDIIQDIMKISEDQKVDIPSAADQDCIAAGIFGDEAVAVLFEFRRGLLTGRKINVFDNALHTSKEEVIRAFILEYYSGRELPPRIITECGIDDPDIISSHLSASSALKTVIEQASTKEDTGIIGMILRNIDMIAAEREAARAYDSGAGLSELKRVLGLAEVPGIMECFDVSNFQGSNAVASMVRFREGLPDREGYRKYKIRGYDSPNDPGMIHEAVSRRLQNIVNDNLEMPDLLVIDGGPTQLGRAVEAASNFKDDIRIISIAKRFEEIYTSPAKPPISLPEGSAGLRLMQRIRDEAHRFAITYHRKIRDKKLTSSSLDEIPGIGEGTRKALLRHFKSLDEIRGAGPDELMAVDGIGRKTAERISAFFRTESQTGK